MKISNLSDEEFKTLVFRMLQGFTGYFNAIKKTQAEMKVALSEIKKNLKEIKRTNGGGDDTKNQINDLEHKEEKSIQSE